MGRAWLAVCAAGMLAVGLTGCASDAAAPVASPSDSGSAAFFGTKGVEATIVNKTNEDGAGQTLYVWNRTGGAVESVAPGKSITYKGSSTVTDDVELGISWNADGVDGIEMDFANPSVGEPNVTAAIRGGVAYWEYFSEGETDYDKIKIHDRDSSFTIKREGDSSDYKRFTVAFR